MANESTASASSAESSETGIPETRQPILVSPADEDPLLKNLRVPEGWTATIFAGGPKLSLPTFVKATPSGEVFAVATEEDEAGSGKILKLIDRSHNGKADEIHEFVPHLDSPRGLEWDGEWLYVMDPPHLTAVRDTDGDHIADENRRLVSGISSGAGITFGIDGWLYLAIGEGGFKEAKGTDGATVQLHGSGVARVRPDGSGLHVFSRGTRDITDVAVSPTLDIFTRDSSSNGGGWEAALHSFSGLDHHGYPTLFRKFREDAVAPLAEYGDGKGAGALFLAEQLLPEESSNVLLTIDRAHHRIYRHRLEAAGASYKESNVHELIGMQNPYDLDVDVERRLYITGRDDTGGQGIGFITAVSPPSPGGKNAMPQPAPIEKGLPTPSLIQYFQGGASNRSRIQQAVLRRPLTNQDLDALDTLSSDSRASIETRIAALFTMKLGFGEKANVPLGTLSQDPEMLPYTLRAFADFPDQKTNLQPELFAKALSSKDPRIQREAVFAASRLKLDDLVPGLAGLTASEDPMIAHMAIAALVEMNQVEDCFEILDDKNHYQKWPGVFRALARIHDMEVVDGIINRLEKTDSSLFRAGALKTLARLYHREKDWDGTSWGSRPDTRGPYFEPITWEGTAAIDLVLRKALKDKRVNKTFLFNEISRNRIPYDDFGTLLSIAAVTPELEEATVTLLLEQEEPPPDSLPFLTFVATSEDRPGNLRLRAAKALARSPDDMAVASAFRLTLERDQIDGMPQLRDDLFETLFNNTSHENRYDWLLEEAHGRDEAAAMLAWKILLTLHQMKKFGSEARSETEAAIGRADSNPLILRRILLAIADFKLPGHEDIVLTALDAPDRSVAEAAEKAAKALDLKSDSATESR